jgi:uncharacterized protein YgiM (DUF1202 family)
MLEAPRNVLPAVFLFLSLFITSGRGGAAESKAAVFGTPTANLRAGAGIEHALKMTLKEGDQVSVEKLEGEWYLVSAADGQKGYVHKNLLKLAADATPQPTLPPQPAPAKINSPEAKEPSKDAAPAAAPTATKNEPPKPLPTNAPAPAPVARVEQPKAAEAKSQSILQMLEGHETEAKIGLLVAGIAFVLGWLCGGGYYARRERKSRHKLRF